MPLEVPRYNYGVRGVELWQYANGRDDSPVSPQGWRPLLKSVGNFTTKPRDLTIEENIRVNVMLLAESVSERLREKVRDWK